MNQGKHHVHKPPAVVQATSPLQLREGHVLPLLKPGKVQVVVEHMDLHGAKKQPMRFLCVHGEMNVQAQIAALSEVLTSRPLPGWPSQSLACPPGRPRDLEERVRDARQAGVVSLLCWHEGQWQVLLMLRTRDNTAHSGQLAFPGGAAEALDGGDLTRTALRE